MEIGSAPDAAPVHAVMLPYPTQGHINPMMELARRMLRLDGSLHITFVNTVFTHARLLQHGNIDGGNEFNGRLRFLQVSDGLPAGHGRINENAQEFMTTIDRILPVTFGQAMKELVQMEAAVPPIACIVADAVLSWTQKVGDELHVPRVVLWTTPVHASLAYCWQAELASKSIIPFKDRERDGAAVVDCIPNVLKLRARDLISFFQSRDWAYEWCALHFSESAVRSADWNLGNSVFELETPAIAAFRAHLGRPFQSVGPLIPPLGNSRVTSGTSLMPENTSLCRSWLDSQPARSVLYVAFGSLLPMSNRQLVEIALGLEASGCRFLWVLREDVMTESTRVLVREVESRASERSLVVSWAPQLMVLSHESVAGFLSHGGWNSISEGMAAGVPFLAWPGGFGEQNMNRRYLVDVWGIGLDFQTHQVKHDGALSEFVTRDEVARVVCRLFAVSESSEVRKRAQEVAAQVKEAASDGGSSAANLREFMEAMRAWARASARK